MTVYDTDAGSVLFRVARRSPKAIEWSHQDRLLVVTQTGFEVYGPQAQRFRRVTVPGIVSAAFSPDGRQIAVLTKSEVRIVDTANRRSRRVFAAAGPLDGLAWSPDGRWLLAGWPGADQWIFVSADGQPIRAVSNVSEQFRSRSFPRVEGWCCAK